MFQALSDYLVYNLFNLEKGSAVASVVDFFIYDGIKIFFFILVITHLMSLIRFYLSIEKLRDFLASKKLYLLDYLFASLFGAVTPFCSCSSIPFFIGFLEAGIPLGVTFAFLITSPLVNEVALAMFLGLFGWKVTLVYGLSGIFIGVIGGYLIGRLKMEKYVEDFVWNIKAKAQPVVIGGKEVGAVLKQVSREALGIMKKITPYVLAGVAVGAFIHGFVPAGFFEKYIAKESLWAVPLAVILGVPLYTNASGVIPIIQSLVVKGIPLGTSLAFMMATVGLSLPEALILKKVIKLKLLFTFFGIVTLGIIVLGYLFNFLVF